MLRVTTINGDVNARRVSSILLFVFLLFISLATKILVIIATVYTGYDKQIYMRRRDTTYY